MERHKNERFLSTTDAMVEQRVAHCSETRSGGLRRNLRQKQPSRADLAAEPPAEADSADSSLSHHKRGSFKPSNRHFLILLCTSIPANPCRAHSNIVGRRPITASIATFTRAAKILLHVLPAPSLTGHYATTNTLTIKYIVHPPLTLASIPFLSLPLALCRQLVFLMQSTHA